MKLHFKFKEHVTNSGREKVFSVLFASGAKEVRPLFPGVTHKQIASLYTVEYQDEAVGYELLKILNSFEEVEFAEEEVRRKMIP
jgi:hypothetical protein